jgi:hypothetical protein
LTQETKAPDAKLEQIRKQKLDLVLKLREIRSELAKVNSQLSDKGAHVLEIVCW